MRMRVAAARFDSARSERHQGWEAAVTVRRLCTGLCVLAASLTISAAAHADRSGQAPVDDPHALDTWHVSFRLVGSDWGQARGQTADTPVLGAYGQTGDRGCRLAPHVSAMGMSARPKIPATHVDVAGHFEPIRIADHGRDHGIRWWLGSQAGVRAAAVGYQRAPAALARPRHRWLIYEVVLRGVSKNPSCTPAQGRRSARAITRSIHLTRGAIR